MRVGSLFSGIGGIDLGLERAGMEIAWQVEIDEWCRRVLAKHWPDVERFGDIRSVGSHNLATVDVLAGGPPCQPVSSAGRQKGADDARWLWPEMVRLIRELRPRYALMENPMGLFDKGNLGLILGWLAESGYDAEWDCIPAAAVGAWHIRDRVWILAYPRRDGSAEQEQQQASRAEVADGSGTRILAHAGRLDGERGRTAGQVASTPRARAVEAPERQRVRNAARDCDPVHADPDRASRAIVFGGDAVAERAGFRAVGRSAGWESEPELGRVVHGLSRGLDERRRRSRVKGLGNAVVPQIVTWIGERIMAVDA